MLRPGGWFWIAVIVLLATMTTLQIVSARQETQTFDEGFYLAAGYSYWKLADFRLEPQHPALGKLLVSFPLLFLNPVLPVDHSSWARANDTDFGWEFMHANRVPADTMLFAGRLMTVGVSLCLGVAIALWTRRTFGAAAAILALLFYCFDPSVLAHGHYVTNELLVTLFAFLACTAWWRYLRAPAWGWLAVTGLLTGLALATKLSALFLFPVVFLLYCIAWRRHPSRFDAKRLVISMSLLAICAFLTVAGTYVQRLDLLIPATRSARLADPSIRMIRDEDQANPIGKSLAWIGGRLGLRAHPFLLSVGKLGSHNTGGHPAYLLGMRSQRGWWYYFPVAFAVKTPIATLAALLLVRVLAAKWLRTSAAVNWPVLLVPLIVYLPLSMTTHINIGLRHLFPIFPFLFIAIGAIIAGMDWNWRAPAAIALGIGLVAETASVHPHHLAFFNRFVGGPAQGARYLLDSNLDWGQDLKKLKAFADRKRIDRLCLAYFGKASPEYYGLAAAGLPNAPDSEEWNSVDCIAAVSANQLYGLYDSPERFARLRQMEPIAKVGYSIYVYDLRKR
jgi:hypothetical protein